MVHDNNSSSSQSPRHVAVKVLTSDSYGGAKPVYELEILKHISRINPSHPGYSHTVHLLNSFVHNGPNGDHLCLVLELMGQSVAQLQQYFPNKRLPQHLGRQIARQVLHVLDWLHGSCGVIHTGMLTKQQTFIKLTSNTIRQILSLTTS